MVCTCGAAWGGTWRRAGARAQRPARAGDPSLNDALGTKAAADARHSARVRTARYLAIMLWFQGTAASLLKKENRPPNGGLFRIMLIPHALDSIKNVPGFSPTPVFVTNKNKSIPNSHGCDGASRKPDRWRPAARSGPGRCRGGRRVYGRGCHRARRCRCGERGLLSPHWRAT
jgi:hypothetical protein